jgi:hypothetical protein
MSDMDAISWKFVSLGKRTARLRDWFFEIKERKADGFFKGSCMLPHLTLRCEV